MAVCEFTKHARFRVKRLGWVKKNNEGGLRIIDMVV